MIQRIRRAPTYWRWAVAFATPLVGRRRAAVIATGCMLHGVVLGGRRDAE